MFYSQTARVKPGGFYSPGPGFLARLLRGLFWTGATAGALYGTTHLLLNPPAVLLQAPERTVQSAEGWIEVQRPFQLYTVESPYFGREQTSYTARRHVSGGGRRDNLVLGDPAAAAPWFDVEIYRIGGEGARKTPLYNELARQSARSGHAIVRYSRPEVLETRFGTFELVDLVLGAQGREPACAGFRLRPEKPALIIAGVACGGPALALDRRALACALDRIDLVASGDDRELGAWFARAELKRGLGCPANRNATSPATRPGRSAAAVPARTWLDKPVQDQTAGALAMRGALGEPRRKAN